MPLGLIAGNGTFPFLILRAARQLGHEVVVVGVEGEAFPALEDLGRELGGVQYHWIPLGHLGTCIKILKQAGVTRAIMAGQVKHTKLFGGVMPDLTLLSVLVRLRSKNTDALIAAVADVLQRHGISLMDSTELLTDLIAPAGILTNHEPTDAMLADLHLAIRWPIPSQVSTSARPSSSRTRPWSRSKRWRARMSQSSAQGRWPARAPGW